MVNIVLHKPPNNCEEESGMSERIDVKEATLDDIEGICCLFSEGMAFQEERDEYFKLSVDAVENFRGFVSQQITNTNSRLIVAKSKREILGYCLAFLLQRPPVFARREYVMITDLVITQEYRRMGLGSRLIREQERWCREKGIGWIEAQVSSLNQEATSFWRKIGFMPHVQLMGKEVDHCSKQAD